MKYIFFPPEEQVYLELLDNIQVNEYIWTDSSQE